MNTLNKINNLRWAMLLMFGLVLFSACTKDEEAVITIASFQYTIHEDNKLEVSFKDYSHHANTYAWDFGDNAGTSTEASPTYAFTDGGTYTVTLTVTGAGGTAQHSKDVTVLNPSAQNHIQNGEFDDTSIWNIIQHNAAANGSVTIADGVAVFDEVIDIPSGEWGSEAHVGINQAVTIEAGSYQFNMDIITNGIDECWFEVWVGTDEPTPDAEYNQDNNATKVLSFNSWDCSATNSVYNGPMAAVSCQDTDGLISLDAGTYYVVIRTGGFTFGEGGITIDNVSMVKIN